MFSPLTRRDFVARSLKAGAIAGAADFAFLNNLPPVSAAEARLAPSKVQFTADIEPLVRLLEDTPRAKVIEAVAMQMRKGVGYQQLLSAVFLAGVRGVQPRPVGFKFHAVLVINSAHLASQAMSGNDLYLPLLWAIDNYKASQKRNQDEGNWAMSAVEESKLPSGSQAKARFAEAMDNWDEEGADRAIVALTRNAGAGEIYEMFWRYGARDFRDIGHKAIFVANSWRTLQTIGFRHAEPVLRSLAYALLEHEGANPAKRDGDPDRPWRQNLERARKIRADWQQGTVDESATAGLLKALRKASPSEACDQVVDMLNRKIAPASVWDALFLCAGELLMQQPGIVGLHCGTSTNALHYAYQQSGNDETRRLMMLQCAAFLMLFRQRMAKNLRTQLQIDTLEWVEPKSNPGEAIEEILTDVSKDPVLAARKTLALANRGSPESIEALMTAARRLIFNKGSDSHDYKFNSAALEDYYYTTPAWRKRFLATSMFHQKGMQDRDSGLMERAREALSKM